MNRIQKVSTFFLAVFKFLIIFLPSLLIFKWMLMDTEFMRRGFGFFTLIESFPGPEGYVSFAEVTWTPLALGIAFASQLLELLPILIGLYALIRIFKHYQQAEIFSISNAKYYRLIGWMFIFYGLIAKSFSDGIMTLAVTLNNAPGHRYIALGYGSPNMEALFCGAVIIVISWVMLEASKLHDEQKYTV